ncbi:hypothetical protein E1176_19040 [Fulvivirga sp. RKSG066]|uniref:hypothetical protein n=1 Tax=Fulvivirga aurantia TaxID=2529383 RepID=UPI0012BCF41B|nr:hypothetical protein [Fulvivirga aurantia]MTI23133.1 hypothetical protein [Fulvivirga aurantia]
MMRKAIFLFSLVLVVLGCSENSKPSKNTVYYFDIDSLLQKQHELLLTSEAKINKHAFVDGDTSTTTYLPDSANWKDELAFFKKMNINKPVLKDVYNTSVVDDTQSNLKIKQFIPEGEDTDDLEVQYLKLYYLEDLNGLKKIEAHYKEDNPIYKSSRYFTMYFDDITGKTALKKFVVKGGQKMILKDSVVFEVSGEVVLP